MGSSATTSRAAAPMRLGRGSAAGALAGLGAYAAHLAAGGEAAPYVALVVLALGIAVAVPLARRRLSLPRLLLVVATAQAALHLVMVGSCGTATSGPDMGAMAGASGLVGSDHPGQMVLAHLSVALLTAAVTCGVDRALLDLAGALVGWRQVLGLWRSPTPLIVHRPRVRVGDVLLGAAQRVVTPASSRGPPQGRGLLDPSTP